MQDPARKPTLAGHLPSPELRDFVHRLIEKIGIKGTAKKLRIGSEAVIRIDGGSPVRAGTIALAEIELAASTTAPRRTHRGALEARGKR